MRVTEEDRWSTVESRRRYYAEVAKAAVQEPRVERDRSGPPRVSVVVRTVDRPALLREAMTSLANQTFGAFEVVLVSDGAPIDASIGRFERHMPITAVELSRRIGRTAALNAGIASAKAPFITYLDDDDIVYPNHLEMLVAGVEGSGREVGYTLAHKVLRDEMQEPPRTLARVPFRVRPYERNDLLVENLIPLASLIHSAASVEHVGGFDERFDLFEDWELLLRLTEDHAPAEIRRFTWEYRFRGTLTSANAIVAGGDALERATAAVYEKHPVQDPRVRAARAATRHALRSRTAAVKRCLERAPDDMLSVVALIGGFGPSGSPRRSLLGRSARVVAASPLIRRAIRVASSHSERVRAYLRAQYELDLEQQALEIERDSMR